MNNIDKNIEKIECITNRIAKPFAVICISFLIGRTLLSFIYGM